METSRAFLYADKKISLCISSASLPSLAYDILAMDRLVGHYAIWSPDSCPARSVHSVSVTVTCVPSPVFNPPAEGFGYSLQQKIVDYC